MSKKLEELREKRLKMANRYDALMTEAEKDGTFADESVKNEFDNLRKDMKNIDGQMKVLNDLLALESVDAEILGGTAENLGTSIDEAAACDKIADLLVVGYITKIKPAFNEAQTKLIEKHDLINALSTGTESEGGVFVPARFKARVLKKLESYGGVREFSTVLRTATGNIIKWPVLNNKNTQAKIVAQNAARGTAIDPIWSFISLGSYGFTSGAVPVPKELIRDSDVDIQAEIIDFLSESLYEDEAQRFTLGTGVDEPKGIVTAATLGVIAASKTALDWKEFHRLKFKINHRARRVAKTRGFVANDSTYELLTEMVDGDNRPMFKPSISEEAGDRFDGDRIYINDAMDGFDAANGGLRPCIYGDLSKYTVRDVGEMEIIRYTEKFAGNGQIGFQIDKHADGQLLAPEGSIVALQLPA
ncbi:MAG: phage major capsid protein [Alphaproteobacteria bacterium]|nr:phage major capsid protein [Alphaproteobacteria bacterium]